MKPIQINSNILDSLRQVFKGNLIDPSDLRYDNARKVWNGMIDRYPALIAQCADTADVISALKFAKDNDLPLAIRGGGHHVAGYAVCDDGLVIDMSLMADIQVDPSYSTRRCRSALGRCRQSDPTFWSGHAGRGSVGNRYCRTDTGRRGRLSAA